MKGLFCCGRQEWETGVPTSFNAPDPIFALQVTEAYLECTEDDRDERLYYLLTQHPGRTLVFANAISMVRPSSNGNTQIILWLTSLVLQIEFPYTLCWRVLEKR